MTITPLPFASHYGRVRTRPSHPLVVAVLFLTIAITGSAEQPTPITPSYCRLGGCLWEDHGERQTKLKGKKKVKKTQLVRIACGWGKHGEDLGIHHIDGRLLLDKKGQPIACYGAGTIFTTAGTHTIGIGDKDFTLEFEPVKWYTFDWTTYSWKYFKDSAPNTDPTLEMLMGISGAAVVFGRGPWGSAKTIILARDLDNDWDWYHGPQPE